MLTADLALSWQRGEQIKPRDIDAGDEEYLRASEDLVALFAEHVGARRASLEESLQEYVGTGTDYKILRGLIKLLTDRCEFETVSGHPDSVLYKLLVGPRGATRDAIYDVYVVTSLFLMDFAPGGTNFPHHHETAEEIYLVIEGEGEMVAGGGMDGVEGRHPAKPGDAYYFRSNCTVGFYNQNKPGAKAYILAVRSAIPLSQEED